MRLRNKVSYTQNEKEQLKSSLRGLIKREGNLKIKTSPRLWAVAKYIANKNYIVKNGEIYIRFWYVG